MKTEDETREKILTIYDGYCIIEDQEILDHFIKDIHSIFREYEKELSLKEYHDIIEDIIIKFVRIEVNSTSKQTSFFSNVIIELIKQFGISEEFCVTKLLNVIIEYVNAQYTFNCKYTNEEIIMEPFENVEKLIEFLNKYCCVQNSSLIDKYLNEKIDNYLIKSFFEYCFMKHNSTYRKYTERDKEYHIYHMKNKDNKE